MSLELVKEFLRTVPRFSVSGNNQALVQCPWCGSYSNGGASLSINMNPDDGTPMLYTCFRASCGAKGFLKPKDLELMGCTDPNTLMELAAYNKSANTKVEKAFNARKSRAYEMVNLDTKVNRVKMEYIQKRLGVKLDVEDLRKLKIQLSLYDFLKINSISRLPFSSNYCDILNKYTIGFLSMYSDYLICRDISKDQKTGRRYIQYRASGKPDPGDMKLYCIPGEIDILNPRPANVNIAEGAFSILGAFLHCRDESYDKKSNNLWLANCGSEYKSTLLHVVKQFGLLDVNLHIWSDSEIKVGKYEKLIREVSSRMHLCSVKVHYNTKAEDFGHAAKDIAVNTVELL